MTRIRVSLIALALALVSACQGDITSPKSDNVGALGSGGMTGSQGHSANVGALGSGG